MSTILDPTLANRYLANQLSDQERHDYEILMLSSPEVIAELEATARLKVGLAKLQDTGELDSLLKQRRRSISAFLMPVAAALAAVTIGVTLWRSPVVHTEKASSLLFASHTSLMEKAGHPLPITITAAFYAKRAEVAVQQIKKPPSAAEVVLRVLPTVFNKTHSYRLRLSRLGQTAFEDVAQIDNLTPTPDDGFIECYVDAARLIPGRYEMIVTDQARSQGMPAGVFMFDLVAG